MGPSRDDNRPRPPTGRGRLRFCRGNVVHFCAAGTMIAPLASLATNAHSQDQANAPKMRAMALDQQHAPDQDRLTTLVTRDAYDAVLFDLDGVLTSTAAIHAKAWKRMFDEYLREESIRTQNPRDPRFHPFDIDADYKRYVDGKPRYEGVRSFLESRSIHLPYGEPSDTPGDGSICALGNRKDAIVKQAIDNGEVQPFPSSVRWVKQLLKEGFKLGVVSSSRNCGPVLRAAKIDHLFQVRVDGLTLEEEDLAGKPAPDSFLRAAEMLGATPARSVVVEDAISGVEAARAGHFGLVIGIDREGHADALLEHGADVVVRDLAEVSSR